MMSLSNGTDSPGAPEARGGRRISFWPMLLGPAAVAAVAVAGRYYSGFEQLDDRLDKLGPYLIGSAAGIYWVRAIVTRNPLYLILTALAASLLCREIHFDGMDRAIFVLLAMCGLWTLAWRSAIREPLRRDRRHTSWLIAAFAIYFLSQLIAKRVFKFVPGERAAHSKLEEGVETMAHLVFIVAGLVASWRSYRGISRDRPKSGTPAPPRSGGRGSAGRVLGKVLVMLSVLAVLVGLVLVFRFVVGPGEDRKIEEKIVEKVWKPEPQLLESLDAAVPEILASQKANGQFGTEPWICSDQNRIFPLAVAWSLEGSAHYHSDKVLDAVVRGGDALIDAQDADGKWVFRKKDNSTWGMIHMPWTYSRWIRAYRLVREAMSSDARARWDKALLLGYEGIARDQLHSVHNIPAYHAMGLYCAGIVFGRDEWKSQSRDFMARVVEAQSPHGWWSEHFGPVVLYNFVYLDALGAYYSMSGDERVLAALERGGRYHAAYTYPDGSAVETVDERTPYRSHSQLGKLPRPQLGNPGFCHTPVGRGYLAHQHALHLAAGRKFDADYAAAMLLHGAEGSIEPPAASRDRHVHRMGGEALVLRRTPWFVSISAYVCPPPRGRWQQDRQNFLSIYHDRTGLIVGGGNTRLQPLWSTFTVGDTSQLKHTPGDEKPDFNPAGDLLHLPGAAVIGSDEETPRLTLTYGKETCSVTVVPRSENELELVYEATSNSGQAVEGHVTLMPHLDQPIRFSTGREIKLDGKGFDHTAKDEGEWVEHAGYRLSLPRGSRVVWPALPHNPYHKTGKAGIDSARLVVVLPFSPEVRKYELNLSIP